MSYEARLCIHEYRGEDCDCPIRSYSDPPTSLSTLDQNLGFEEQGQLHQVQSSQVTVEDENQGSSSLSLSDEQASSSDSEDVESDYDDTVDGFDISINSDLDLQDSYLYEINNLNDLDLTTPAILSTPHSYVDQENIPASHNLSLIASSSNTTEQATESETRGQFKCPKCPKLFKTKSKCR